MSTMSLAISGTSIRQDSNGRFCLNDLHKAAGSEKRHAPSYWLAIQQTKELIEELIQGTTDITVVEQNQPVITINGGNNRGTFVVKELVYAYATWISAKFFLSVIRAYDSLVSKPAYALKDLPRPNITGMEAAQLKKSVEAACKTNKKLYSELYRKLYAAYGIDSYMNLPAGKLNEALVFLGLKPAEMPKTVMISVEEYNALKMSKPEPKQGMLVDMPTLMLALPNDNNRIVVIRHNGVTSMFEMPENYLFGSPETLARDLKALGYIVVKKDEVVSRLAA
jgi:hypothetical protein